MPASHFLGRTVLAALALTGSDLIAAQIDYTGVSGGEWATDGNWNGAAYPDSTDVAVLDTTANLSVEAPNNIQGIRIGTNGSGGNDSQHL